MAVLSHFYVIMFQVAIENILYKLKGGIFMNVLENIPYNEERMGNRKIIDAKYLMIMQIALKPGQTVPQHNANSNVHLLVLKGGVTVELNGENKLLKEGDLQFVEYKTPMKISNTGNVNATFLVLKTPNPSEMGK